MRVLVWNINFGFDSAGTTYNVTAQAAAAAALSPDIVILCEADINRSRSNYDNQPEIFRDACGLSYLAYNNAAEPSSGQGGNAILSRYPLATSRLFDCEFSHIFTDQQDPIVLQRGWCAATFYLDGAPVTILAVHLDGENNDANVDEIAALLGSGQVIVAGDFNSLNNSAEYTYVAAVWDDQTAGLDVDATQLDYIFTQNLAGTGAYDAAGGTSDHRLYYVDF